MNAPMKARDIYPDAAADADRCGYYGVCDYEPIIKSFGDVLIMKSTDDYQGDTLVMLRSEIGGYGYLVFGWGSCSCCDELQGCTTFKEVDELINKLWAGIHWERNLDDLKEWMGKRDWETQWERHIEIFPSFLANALLYKENEITRSKNAETF